MTQNVPMLKEKSEGQLNVTYGGTHVEGQFAYSPVKNWMVVGNSWIDYYLSHGYSNECGAGYYHLGKSGNELEVLGLYTSSRQQTHVNASRHNHGLNPIFISYPQDFKADYSGYSLQFNAGKHLASHGMQIAISAKYTFLHYTDFYYFITEGEWNENSKYYSDGGFETDSVYSLKNKNQHMLVMGFTFKLGKGRIKYMAQAALHMNLQGEIFRTHIPPFYNPLVISNVLQIGFNVPGKKSKER